jgi:hypothetical protein
MACEHKFINDLQLQYVNWKPKTLFIGTFNPEWLECENNSAQWFYGRTQRNEFWNILPTTFGQPSLLEANRLAWINFCREKEIAITDILSSIEADKNNYNTNLYYKNGIIGILGRLFYRYISIYSNASREKFEIKIFTFPISCGTAWSYR